MDTEIIETTTDLVSTADWKKTSLLAGAVLGITALGALRWHARRSVRKAVEKGEVVDIIETTAS